MLASLGQFALTLIGVCIVYSAGLWTGRSQSFVATWIRDRLDALWRRVRPK